MVNASKGTETVFLTTNAGWEDRLFRVRGDDEERNGRCGAIEPEEEARPSPIVKRCYGVYVNRVQSCNCNVHAAFFWEQIHMKFERLTLKAVQFL